MNANVERLINTYEGIKKCVFSKSCIRSINEQMSKHLLTEPLMQFGYVMYLRKIHCTCCLTAVFYLKGTVYVEYELHTTMEDTILL